MTARAGRSVSFRPVVVVAVVLSLPAIYQLWQGNLSVTSLLVRFAGALVVGWAAVAVVAAVARGQRADAEPADAPHRRVTDGVAGEPEAGVPQEAAVSEP